MSSGLWIAVFLAAQGVGQDSTIDTDQAAPAKLTGELLYPSCMGPPEDMKVCAEPVEGGESVCTTNFFVKDEAIQYALDLPAGSYLVYAQSPSTLDGHKAYFSRAVECGLAVQCEDHTPVVVTVSAGSTVRGVHPADWFDIEKKEELVSWMR